MLEKARKENTDLWNVRNLTVGEFDRRENPLKLVTRLKDSPTGVFTIALIRDVKRPMTVQRG